MILSLRFVVLVLLLPGGLCSSNGPPVVEEAAFHVPPPANVTVDSYNLNTSLRWDYKGYKNMTSKPVFTVELREYDGSKSSFKEVDTCVNITQHYCDLTYKIVKLYNPYWVKVKVLLGSQDSVSEEQRFMWIKNGQIGPPKLTCSVNDDEIIIDIENPLSPRDEKSQLGISTDRMDLSFNVYLCKKESPQECQKHTIEECQKNCMRKLPVPFPNVIYCVSAETISEEYLIQSEKSRENCVFPSKHPSGLTVPVIIAIAAAVIGSVAIAVILTLMIICKSLKEKNITPPKSLVAVVRSMHLGHTFETKADRIATHVSTYTLVHEDEKSIEQRDPESENEHIEFSCSPAMDPGYSQERSNQGGETSVESASAGETPGSEHLEASGNYSKSFRGQEEICDIVINKDLAKVHVQQPTNVGSCRAASGYDKPHWLCSDDSLIAERSTYQPEA